MDFRAHTSSHFWKNWQAAVHVMVLSYVTYVFVFLWQGHEGLNKMLVGFTDKGARAVCTFAYSSGPGAEPELFVGETKGSIVPARGPTNFGWDPIFEPTEGGGKTYAEMTASDKNAISHRGRSLEKVRTRLQQLQTE